MFEERGKDKSLDRQMLKLQKYSVDLKYRFMVCWRNYHMAYRQLCKQTGLQLQFIKSSDTQGTDTYNCYHQAHKHPTPDFSNLSHPEFLLRPITSGPPPASLTDAL